ADAGALLMARARRAGAARAKTGGGEGPRRSKTRAKKARAKPGRANMGRPNTGRGEAAVQQRGGEGPPRTPPGSRGARTPGAPSSRTSPSARPTRDYHPAARTRAVDGAVAHTGRVEIPNVRGDVEIEVGGRPVRLTN